MESAMSDRASIVVLDDGPYVVEGLEELSNSNEENLEIGGKVALCRCGASANKPYCDGTHKKIGFTNKTDNNEFDRQVADGESKICVLNNGPLEVSGAIELKVEDEMNLSEDNPYYLCRCGASENKPFCDGSHKKIGFTDDKN
jgi:CDGSH-type Zn-finger protein